MNFETMLEMFYRQLNLNGAEVVDIGAHSGRHAVPLSNLIGMDGICYAFEPIPSIRKTLCENLSLNGLNNTVVYPFALSSSTKRANFNFIPNLPEESGLQKRHIYNAVPEGIQEIPVKVTTLDDILISREKISFIKIDVEGGELDVLRGAKRLMLKSRPIVAFECGAASFLGYHKTPDEIFQIFDSMGFKIYSITGDYIPNVESFARATTSQNYWDYIALPSVDERLLKCLGSN